MSKLNYFTKLCSQIINSYFYSDRKINAKEEGCFLLEDRCRQLTAVNLNKPDFKKMMLFFEFKTPQTFRPTDLFLREKGLLENREAQAQFRLIRYPFVEISHHLILSSE